MKRFALISILLSACMMGFAQGCLDPLLSQEMDRRSDGEQIEVVVLMKAKYDRLETCPFGNGKAANRDHAKRFMDVERLVFQGHQIGHP